MDIVSGTLQFELVSPEASLVNEPAAMVVIPATDGDIGVLPLHTPLVSTIRPGVVNIYKHDTNTVTDQIFLAGGVVDVTQETCTILAEQAFPVAKLNKDEIESSLAQLNEDFTTVSSDAEKTRLQQKIEIETTKLDACQQAA